MDTLKKVLINTGVLVEKYHFDSLFKVMRYDYSYLRFLHPLGAILVILWIVWTPIICLFSEHSLLEVPGTIKEEVRWW
jgi:hypothetical protein